MYFDELSDEEADYYNERITHFENGNYEGTRKVDLNAFKSNRLEQLLIFIGNTKAIATQVSKKAPI